MTLNRAGEWESSRICNWLACGVEVEHQTWGKKFTNIFYGQFKNKKKRIWQVAFYVVNGSDSKLLDYEILEFSSPFLQILASTRVTRIEKKKR